MAKFQGELKHLPITALHENENNIRDGYDPEKVEFIAKQIKQFGVISPLIVYPHPHIDGDYLIREGNHRYLAALKIEEQELPCIVKPATKRDAIADLDAMMSTGRSHTPLKESEVSHGIQQYFVLGQDLTTIGKKNDMSRKEVQARSRVVQKNDEVSKAYSAGRLTLDTVQRLQELEDQSEDPQLYERVLEKIESMSNGASLETVERVINDTERAVTKDRNREKLKELGVPEADSSASWSSQYQQVEDEQSFEEHHAAGHQWRIDYYDSEPTWYSKKESKEVAEPEPTPEEIAEQERLDRLASKLAIVRNNREKFVVGRLQSKDLPEVTAKQIVTDRIFKMNRDEDSLVLLGHIASNTLPDGDRDKSDEEHDAEMERWLSNIRKYFNRLSLTQLIFIEEFMKDSFRGPNLGHLGTFERSKSEENSWFGGWNKYAPYYGLLIDDLGYELDPAEVEVMVHMAKKAPDRVKEYDLVQVPTDECTGTCEGCSQEVVADAEWAGQCVNCIGDAKDSE